MWGVARVLILLVIVVVLGGLIFSPLGRFHPRFTMSSSRYRPSRCPTDVLNPSSRCWPQSGAHHSTPWTPDGRDLADYESFLRARGRNPLDATGDDIRDHLADLAQRGMAASTSARHLSAIRQFHRFLFLEGGRGDDPTAKVDGPNVPRPLPKVLDEDEVTALIDASRDRQGAESIRLTALLELLYATGLRVSELAALPLSALAPDRSLLRVRGKGGKERIVPIGGPARTALQAWLEIRAGRRAAGRRGGSSRRAAARGT